MAVLLEALWSCQSPGPWFTKYYLQTLLSNIKAFSLPAFFPGPCQNFRVKTISFMVSTAGHLFQNRRETSDYSPDCLVSAVEASWSHLQRHCLKKKWKKKACKEKILLKLCRFHLFHVSTPLGCLEPIDSLLGKASIPRCYPHWLQEDLTSLMPHLLHRGPHCKRWKYPKS